MDEAYKGLRAEELVFGRMADLYGTEREYSLDLIKGEGAEEGKRLPVAFMIHGGGFTRPCDKRHFYIPIFSRALTAEGWAVVSPDYPVYNTAEEVDFLRAVSVEAEAIQLCYEFVRDHAEELSVDISRAVILGGSAGAMGAFYTIAANPGQYKAFVNLWGPPFVLPSLESFPPVLSVHGTADGLVPFSLEAPVQAELERLGIRHELIALEGAGHTPVDERELYLGKLLGFLQGV